MDSDDYLSIKVAIPGRLIRQRSQGLPDFRPVVYTFLFLKQLTGSKNKFNWLINFDELKCNYQIELNEVLIMFTV